MKYKPIYTITKRSRRDKRVWYAIMDTMDCSKPRTKHLQAPLTEIMEIATEVAIKTKPPVDFFESLGHGDGLLTANATLHFLRSVQENHPLSRRLSPLTFVELFCEVIEDREAYLADYEDRSIEWPPFLRW